MQLRDFQWSRELRTLVGVLVAGLSVLFLSGCITSWRGASDAHDDIDAGRFTFWAGGYYTDERIEMERIMEVEYSMLPKGIGHGCFVTSAEEDYAFGYFSVMNDAIESRFGKDFHERVRSAANENLKTRGPMWRPSLLQQSEPTPVTPPGT